MRRAARWLILATLLLSLVLVVLSGMALGWLLGSAPGARWLLAQVPGLTVEDFDGALASEWRARTLIWEGEGVRIGLADVHLVWRPQCLLEREVCLDQLRARQLDIDVSPREDDVSEEAGPVYLPPIALPLPVHLGALDLADLRVNGTSVTQDIHLAADFWAGHWQVHALRARYEDYAASLQGQLQPQDEWPLQVTGEVRLPPLHEQPWAIGLEGTGSVRNLVLKLTSQGYYAAQADAQIQPLSPGVPIRLHLLSDHLRADPAVPDTLVMQAVKLLAEGNLDDGFLVDLQAALPGIGQRIDLSLKGLVGLEDARIDSLQLSGTQAVDGRLPSLQLSGQVGWAQGLRLDTRARWQDFPWQALLAEAPEVPVRLRQAELDVKLEDARYTGTLNARLEGPAGPFSLTTPFAGDERRVALEGLNLRADQGVLSGRLDVGFADQLDWAYALRLDGLNPAFWVAELPGRLAGDLVGRGSLAGEALHLETTARVQGPLRDLPLDLALQARLAPGTLELPEARLRWGDNRIDAQAQWAQALEARLELALPALAQLWPGLQGQASGTLTLAGTPDDPRGRVELNAQGLGFADVRSESLNWQAELHPGQRLDSVLTLERLKAAGQNVRRAELRIDGGLDQHRIALTAKERRDRLALTLDGSWIQGLWQGTLSEARVQVARQDWQLEAPAALRVEPQRDVVLGEHCWQWEAARLCAEDQPLWPQTRIRLALTAFPLSWLADQWPGEARWKASLAAGVALDLLAEGPQGRIFIDAGHGELELPAGDAWVSLVHERFRVEAELTPATISLNADLFGPALGELQARVQLDPHAEDPVLEGEYRIHDLNLSLVQSVAPLETLEGALQGEGRLAGTLLAPRVFGGLSVVRGRVADPQLPLSLEDLTLDAQVEDQGLTLSGQWRSGERGQGTLDGELDWSGAELRGDLRLQAQRLPVEVEPFVRAEVAPDLAFSVRGERMRLSGMVSIPRGSVVVKALPEQAVQVSPDVQVVGREVTTSPATRIAMDLDVVVGEDRVSFEGFGLTGNLMGRLRIRDDLDTRGELSMLNGRYAAYGQRLSLRRARVLFAGPIDQPYLDIEAIREVEDVVAGLRLTGRADRPTTTVFAEPAMSQEQALSWLITGRPLGGAGGDNTMMARAALGLGLAGTAGITRDIGESLGIQDLKLETEGSGTDASVVASGYLTDRLSVRYGVGLFEPVTRVALRYDISRKLYLEAASGLASSLDLFYRRDF